MGHTLSICLGSNVVFNLSSYCNYFSRQSESDCTYTHIVCVSYTTCAQCGYLTSCTYYIVDLQNTSIHAIHDSLIAQF